ncbi:MAG: LacI family DNA-binding transcriptional regulator [Anaerolineae bacterium]|nr:LacI family DNA-binding transcriptional regulator [Anaerolineae bacterium]
MATDDKHPQRLVTQEDVARRAGVSRSIVSYVINNGPRSVSEETQARVLEAIRELGYRPNKHAQLLSATDNSIAHKYIGIVIAGDYMFKRPYYGSILASIHEHAHVKDYHIRFIRVFDDFSNPALFNELIHPDEINGAILLGLDQVIRTAEDRTLVEQIVQRVENVVTVEWEWDGVPSVQFDRQDAGYQITKHLADVGKRRIAYIGPEDDRLLGYRQALWERKITPDDRLAMFAVDTPSGYDICEKLLTGNAGIDGICIGTDEVAIGVLKSLYQRGLHVPRDVAVASIDNLNFAEFLIPSLTSIDVPRYELGNHVIDALIGDRTEKNLSAFSIMIRTQLIVRESSMIQD